MDYTVDALTGICKRCDHLDRIRPRGIEVDIGNRVLGIRRCFQKYVDQLEYTVSAEIMYGPIVLLKNWLRWNGTTKSSCFLLSVLGLRESYENVCSHVHHDEKWEMPG
jgi:hypothetical protein